MESISLGPWGGSGRSRWSYRPRSGITEIVLNVGENIRSISFREASGQASGKFGGDGGEEQKIEIKWPSEYLKSISGTYGGYEGVVVITSLSFNTNVTTYGPFGGASGEQTSFDIPIEGSEVVGFHGRSGDYVDAIAIFVRPAAGSNGSISLGPWGGDAGPNPSSYIVPVGLWINQITVNHGDCIFALSFKDSNGTTYGPFGGINSTGEETIVDITGNLERLSSITGTHGVYSGYEVITSLSFRTNQKTYGPFGTATGTSFAIPIGGSVVNGFHGRTGWYVDALGIFVRPEMAD